MTAEEIDTAGRRLKKALMERTIVKMWRAAWEHIPTDEAATTLIWLALRNITATWSHPAHHWRGALNPFAILYEDRFLKGPVA